MTMEIIICKECKQEVDVTSAKSPKQVKYCDTCKLKVRKEKQRIYYKNKKLKCSCGANNNKNKTRCWRCGKGLKEILLFQKPKSGFRQLEIMA